MSFHEIAYRLREEGRIGIERAGLYRPPSAGSFKDLLTTRAHAFYRGANQSSAAFVKQHFPNWIDSAINEADRLCDHQVELLQMGPVNLGTHIDWHRDPYSGRQWERTFWAQYRPEHDPMGRDSKVIHELNRHQHLPRLAKAYLLTGNEHYANEALEQMLSWIAQSPTGVGINWQSSLEIAIRAISWTWTLFLLRSSDALTVSAVQTIGNSLFAQFAHIERHTSLYSSPNTHLIGEAAALFIAGLIFANDTWRDTGVSILGSEAGKQIGADGVYAENSTYYHCYALDFYMQAFILARQNEYVLPEIIPAKIEAMTQALMHLTRPDGSVPLLGDDDGGRALALDSPNYRSFRDGLCIGSILFERGDFKHASGSFAQEAFWTLGEGAVNEYRAIPSFEPHNTELYCADSGHLSQRTGWTPSDSHLIFDFGGLGMLTGGHSHADSLSLTLFGAGKELLIDPGTFVYNNADHWRRHFRSTAAHNTVTVDGQDQAAMGGTFRWTTSLPSQGSRHASYSEGEHRGYESLGITHRRAVVQIPGGSWLLIDELRGSGAHDFDFHYHFGVDVELESQDSHSVVVRSPDLYLAIHTSAPVTATLEKGWMSRGYGHKQPIQSLRATVHHAAPVWAATLLVPGGHRTEIDNNYLESALCAPSAAF
jgi:hypothetical protein